MQNLRPPSAFCRVLLLTLLLSNTPALTAQADERYYEETFPSLGTMVTLSLYGLEPKLAQQISAVIAEDLQRMHGFWHPSQAGPLGRVNKLLPTGGHFSIPPSTLPLFTNSFELSRKSRYLFNPAIGRLIRLWGFDKASNPAQRQPPDKDKIAALVQSRPRLDNLELDGLRLVSNNPAVLLDFGGFAKGVAIDISIARLKELGVHHAIVNAGGDLRAIGQRGQRAWRVGIKHPRGNGVMALLEIQGDESIFTSGDYERYFMYKGRRYQHIIDPRNGYPATDTMSVTVIHNQAATADAAATALFVAGPKQWQQIAAAMGILQVMLISQDKKIYLSRAMAKRIQFEPGIDYAKILVDIP